MPTVAAQCREEYHICCKTLQQWGKQQHKANKLPMVMNG